jgi:hypothetical protein
MESLLGSSAMPSGSTGCKAPAILRSEAYLMYAATTKDKGNAADGLFSSTC